VFLTVGPIYSRSKAANSEMITVQLLKAYCLRYLFYCTLQKLFYSAEVSCKI